MAAALIVTACGGGHSSAAPSRCGRTSLTGVTWVGTGWVGVGVPFVAIGYYDGWYDPVDTYDPAIDGADSTDTTIYDPTGSGGESPVDVPATDGTTDPGAATDFGGGTDSSGSDSSGSDSSGDTGGDSSTESIKPLVTPAAPGANATNPPRATSASSAANQTSASDANGCYTCTVGCLAAGANGQQSGRQALGVSDVSHDDACRDAVRSLATWSHGTLHQRLSTCEQANPDASTRVPAAPSVAPR